jgi:hypothetical protein
LDEGSDKLPVENVIRRSPWCACHNVPYVMETTVSARSFFRGCLASFADHGSVARGSVPHLARGSCKWTARRIAAVYAFTETALAIASGLMR